MPGAGTRRDEEMIQSLQYPHVYFIIYSQLIVILRPTFGRKNSLDPIQFINYRR
jgi:hypothetical protein